MRRLELDRSFVTASESAQSLSPYRSQLCQFELIAQGLQVRNQIVSQCQSLSRLILGAEHHGLIARRDQGMKLIIERRKDVLCPTIGLACQFKETGHMGDGSKVEVAVRCAIKATQRDELLLRRDEPGALDTRAGHLCRPAQLDEQLVCCIKLSQGRIQIGAADRCDAGDVLIASHIGKGAVLLHKRVYPFGQGARFSRSSK
jgi:hypothetical protein